MDTYYPDIDEGYLVPIDVILAGMAGDPLWLERKACPYDPATKACLKAMVRKVEVRAVGGADAEFVYAPLTDDQLEQDLAKLHADLRNFKPGEGIENDIGYFRVAVSLMTKIVELRERTQETKKVGDFQRRVIEVFEIVLSPQQASTAIAMLAP